MSAYRTGVHAVGVCAVAAAIAIGAAPLSGQSPDSVLKGITLLGVEVDSGGAQATACGVSRDALLAAATKALGDGGLKVSTRGDTDVFLYVNVNTVGPTASLCVSRYDVSLNAYVNATLPYQTQSALLQVLLAREGGLSGSGPGTHGEALIKSVKQHVDQFVKRIRGAAAATR
jgi:hypothetical protein